MPSCQCVNAILNGAGPPRFRALRYDFRNMLVGPQGLIHIGWGLSKHPGKTAFKRLCRVVDRLSQEIPLHEGIAFFQSEAGYLLRLQPTQPDQIALSQIHDKFATAARRAGGQYYVGNETVFVQYRDTAAPRGYDLRGRLKSKRVAWNLIGTNGFCRLEHVVEKSLRKLMLRMPPTLNRKRENPALVYVVAAAPLHRMLSRYFRAHGLQFQVARFLTTNGADAVMFRIKAQSDANADAHSETNANADANADVGKTLPAFVLAYLEGLPRCRILVQAACDNVTDRRLLIAWGYSHSYRGDRILDLFPQNCLVVAAVDDYFGSFCLAPGPIFWEADRLVRAQLAWSGKVNATPRTIGSEMCLDVPVRLTRYHGPAVSTAAFILDQRQTAWLKGLLYRLPASVFSGYSCCRGQTYTILLKTATSIQQLPFGIPLRRYQDNPLFLPLRNTLKPELPWKILAQSLDLANDHYIFLTPDFRLDIPRTDFSPLSKQILSTHIPIRIPFVKPPASGERNQQPVLSEKRVVAVEADQSATLSVMETTLLLSPFGPELQGVRAEEIPQPKDVAFDREAGMNTSTPNKKGSLRQIAIDAREGGDFLTAAVLFKLTHDYFHAAWCFQKAYEQGQGA